MTAGYKKIQQDAMGEITEKKSHFIAHIHAADSKEEAERFIAEMQKKYYDARHNCYAYIIGKENPYIRYSDDGEPQKTAGLPILEVLQGENLYDTVAVVTRYFGGILLGTGGLVRAYSDAVKCGLSQAKLVTMQAGIQAEVVLQYTYLQMAERLFSEEDIEVQEKKYEDMVTYTLMVPLEKKDILQKKIIEMTGGTGKIHWKEICDYAKKASL